MSKDSHSFSVSVAQQIGVPGAIVMQHFLFLQKSNVSDAENWQQKWVKRSAKSISKTYPYWSGKQVATITDNLEKGEYIFSKIENASKIDRAKSFILTPKGLLLMGEIPFAQMENGFSKKGNANAQTENAIPENGKCNIEEDYTSFVPSFEREQNEKNPLPPIGNSVSVEAEKEKKNPPIPPVPPCAGPTLVKLHDATHPDIPVFDIVPPAPVTHPPANRIELGDRPNAETPTQLQKNLEAFYNCPDWQNEWADGVCRISGVWIPDSPQKESRLKSILSDFCDHAIKNNQQRDTYRQLNAAFQQWVKRERYATWKQPKQAEQQQQPTGKPFQYRQL